MTRRRTTSVTWNGREVEHQPWRFLVTVLAVAFGAVGALLALVSLAILIPLSLPLHCIVWLFNRRGFWNSATNSYDVPWWASLLIIGGIAALILL